MSDLPHGWAFTKLPTVCTKITDGTHHSPSNLPAGAFRYVTAKNIRKWGLDLSNVTYVDEATHQEIYSRCPPEKGDILYIKDGATTGLAIVNPLDEPFSMLSSVALIKPDRNAIDPEFLKNWLNSPSTLESMLGQMTGTAIRRLTLTTISAQEVPLPPFPEQRRIVQKLDTLVARTTTARTHLTAIEKLAKRMRGAVLTKALKGTLVSEQLGYGEPTELGQFILGIEQGWSPKCDNEIETNPENWAVLTTTAIQAVTFDSAENKRLPDHMPPRPHLEVQVGDVLMTRAGPRVRCAVCCYVAVTTPRRIISDKIYRIRLDPSVEAEFFAMMMNAPEVVRALDLIKSGGSESGLNLTQDRLKSLSINLWDRDVQRAVVAEIKRQFAKIDRLAAEATKALKLTDRLDQRILAKAFAGELVLQDPSDEPAEQLLARIREERNAEPPARRARRAKN